MGGAYRDKKFDLAQDTLNYVGDENWLLTISTKSKRRNGS